MASMSATSPSVNSGRAGLDRRHPVEDRGMLPAGRNYAGLDHYQARDWRAWYAHITLSMAAHAWLTVAKTLATKRNRLRWRQDDRLHRTGDPRATRGVDPATHHRPDRICLVDGAAD